MFRERRLDDVEHQLGPLDSVRVREVHVRDGQGHGHVDRLARRTADNDP